MPILRYENLSHVDLSSLDRDKTAVFVPSGPLEQHGPHLPLGVDAFTAEFFSQKMAERLQAKYPDWSFVLFPTIFAGSDTLTYAGTIEVSPRTLRALLYDCCRQLAKDGFRNLIAVGAHGGPRHIVVLEEVAARMRWRHRVRMISASSRILFEVLEGSFIEKIASQLARQSSALTSDEREALKTDYHGGFLETSLMMVAKPDLVKPIYKELKPAVLDRVWKMRRSSGKKVGEGLGHLGSPALARREVGEAAIEVLLSEVSPDVERFLEGKNVNKAFRSKFYYIPFFRTDFKLFLVILIYMLFFFIGLGILNQYALEMYR
ncbi:MAG: creatininase family protein [Bdellovibrionota bacterium]